MSLLLDGDTLFISNSSLETAQMCPRAFEYSKLKGREKARAKGELMAGKAWHTAKEHGGGDESVELSILAREMAGVESSDHRTTSRMCEALRRYNRHFQNDDFEVIATEMRFAAPMGVIGGVWDRPIKVVYQGLIDRVLRWRGQLWLHDYKTTGRWGDSSARAHQMGGQFPSYCWAYWKIYGEMPEGVILDPIVIRSESSKEPYSFPRTRVQYEWEDLQEWWRDSMTELEDLTRHWWRGHFPMRRSSCWRCQFGEVCEQPAELREAILMSDLFRDREPSPLEQTENK